MVELGVCYLCTELGQPLLPTADASGKSLLLDRMNLSMGFNYCVVFYTQIELCRKVL